MTEIEIINIQKDSLKNTFSVDVEFREDNMLTNITFHKTDIFILEEILKELRR